MNRSIRSLLTLRLKVLVPIIIGRVSRYLYRQIYFILMFLFYGRLDRSCFISPFASIRNHHQVVLGGKTVINRNSVIWAQLVAGGGLQLNPGSCIYGNVVIGNNVMIAPNVVIAGGNHGTALNGIPMCFQQDISIGVIIGNDVWVGANSVILDGVIIGDGAIIAAGAVVNRNVEKYSVVAGVPARKVKMRSP